MNKDLKFSIVIPTYNEEKDIAHTLDLLTRLDYPNKEIIVVDDSIDNTPNIVKKYANKGVKLIKPKVRQGRCEARNIGIRSSLGDIIVILNADVLLPKDFINRIKKHYDAGYDAVGVMNLVENHDSVYSRYIGMHNHRKEETGVFQDRKIKLNDIWWTEGFSVKRSFIMKTSLFPSGYSVPIVAGEDVRFVDELRKLGCKGMFDKSILITHIAPSVFKEYWNIRKGRGAGTPQVRYFIDGWDMKTIKKRAALKVLRRLLYTVTILPVLKHNYSLAKFSTKNIFIETIVFSYAWLIEQVAMSVGEYQSIQEVIKKERL